MAERNYNGPVIDCTWSNGPWSNDGETIEASDDNTNNGTMDTIEWPEGATPREELNDNQIAVIEKAARYPNIDNGPKLTQLAVGDKFNRSYSNQVLKTHWEDRYWGDWPAMDDRGSPTGHPGSENHTAKLSKDDVKEIRNRALEGESVCSMAGDYPVQQQSLSKAVTGINWSFVESPPPLEYDRKKGRYVIPGVEIEHTTTETEQEEEQQEQETPEYDPTPVTQKSSTDYAKYLSVVAIVYMVYRVLRRLF